MGGTQNLIVDDKEMASGVWFPGVTFSPDSKHIAYWVNATDRDTTLSVDGVPAASYTNVSDSGPRFTSRDTLFGVAFRHNVDYRVEVKIVEH